MVRDYAFEFNPMSHMFEEFLLNALNSIPKSSMIPLNLTIMVTIINHPRKKSSKLHSIWIIFPFFELQISHCFGQAPLQRCSTWPPVLRRWTSWSRRWRCSKQCSGRHRGGRRCCWWRKGRSRWRCDLETMTKGGPQNIPSQISI